MQEVVRGRKRRRRHAHGTLDGSRPSNTGDAKKEVFLGSRVKYFCGGKWQWVRMWWGKEQRLWWHKMVGVKPESSFHRAESPVCQCGTERTCVTLRSFPNYESETKQSWSLWKLSWDILRSPKLIWELLKWPLLICYLLASVLPPLHCCIGLVVLAMIEMPRRKRKS